LWSDKKSSRGSKRSNGFPKRDAFRHRLSNRPTLPHVGKYVIEREMPRFVSGGFVYAMDHMPNGTYLILMNTRGADVTPGTRIADEGTLD
jgi:hypothetical protein